MKICSICKLNKPLSQFYKDKLRFGGYGHRCKDCERVVKRNQRVRNKETFRNKDKKYYLKHKDIISKKRSLWYKLNPLKTVAHELAKKAIKLGKLKKLPCEICHNPTSLAHHDNYNKPLKVRWLCHKHHMLHHYGK